MTKSICYNTPMNIAFFGTPEFSTFVIEELITGGYTPSLIITTPDRPAGRGLDIIQSPVKKFALVHNIEVVQPEKLDEEFISDLKQRDLDLIVVAAYGKILPSSVLSVAKHPALNVHPSLLPKYRGTSPIESQILAGEEHIGVTVIEMDEKMDHGPILAQEQIEIVDNSRDGLNNVLWHKGGQLLTQIIPKWISGEITGTIQDHDQATFTKKISKEDGELKLTDDGITNDRKYRAYFGWPGSYFFDNGKRIKITKAHLADGPASPSGAGKHFVIDEIIPENGKRMSWKQYQKRV